MYEYRVAEVVRVVDGDTIYVDLDLGFGVTKHAKVRLIGIDTPELRGRGKEKGLAARDFVDSWFELHHPTRELVLCRTSKDRTGKYGRWLADFMAGGSSLVEELRAAGHEK